MLALQLDCPGYVYDSLRRTIHAHVRRRFADRRVLTAVVSLWLALFVRFVVYAAPLTTEPTTLAAVTKVLDLRELPLLNGAQGAAIRHLGMLFYETPGDIEKTYAALRKQLEQRGFKEQPGGNHGQGSASGSFVSQGYTVAASVTGGSTPERVQIAVANHGNVDLNKLPTPKGVKPFYARAGETSYLAQADVAATAAACEKLLVEAGWEPYGAASDDPMSPMQYFKRGVIRIMCWVSTAPAQQNQTYIRYSADLLSADIPLPAIARSPRFDEMSAKLTFAVSDQETGEVFTFYQSALAKQGWQATTDEPIGDEEKRKKFMVFRNPGHDMLSLDIVMFNDVADVSATFYTAADVKRMDELARQEAQRIKAEMAERNKPVDIALALPAEAKKLKHDDANKLEFKLPAGTGSAAIKQFDEQLRQAGWTGNDKLPTDSTTGWIRLTKERAHVVVSYWDTTSSGAEITIEGSEHVKIKPLRSKDAPAEVAKKKPGKKRSLADVPGVPKLPDGIVLPDMPEEIGELLDNLDADEARPTSQPTGGAAKVAELPIPASASGVEYNKVVKMVEVTSDAAMSEFARALLDALTEQGWETTQRPLIDDDSCIIKLRRGSSDMTAMGDGTDEGCKVTLMCKALDWSVVPPSRVAVKRSPSKKSLTKTSPQRPTEKHADSDAAPDDTTSDDEPRPAAPRHTARVVPAAEQKLASASLWVGATQHRLTHGVAYQVVRDGSTAVEVLLAVKPISGEKLAALHNAGRDGGDAAGFDPHLKLRFNEQGALEYLFFYANGLSINRQNPNDENVQAQVELADGRVRGKAAMEKPEKIFDDEFRFDATIDVPLATADGGAPDGEPAPTDELGAEEIDGFPYPLLTASRSSIGSRYRKTIELTVPTALEKMVAFYRRELTQRGWQEEPAAAKLTADAAELSFRGNQGAIAAKLAKQDADVNVTIEFSDAIKAQADGMVPKANHARLVLGNGADREATVVINGKPYKLPAGHGAENPKQGTVLDALPGKYTLVFKSPGQADQTETIVVAIGQTWGAIVLPTGDALVDRLY